LDSFSKLASPKILRGCGTFIEVAGPWHIGGFEKGRAN
jgi:hypothetical protein